MPPPNSTAALEGVPSARRAEHTLRVAEKELLDLRPNPPSPTKRLGQSLKFSSVLETRHRANAAFEVGPERQDLNATNSA